MHDDAMRCFLLAGPLLFSVKYIATVNFPAGTTIDLSRTRINHISIPFNHIAVAGVVPYIMNGKSLWWFHCFLKAGSEGDNK